MHETIPVIDPYNMYYTPDGKYAIVVAEMRERLEFYDARTMKLAKELWVPCKGVDHMDFSANGRFLIASCEFGEAVIKVDVAEQKLLGRLPIKPAGMPQDVKTSPDGSVFYVADMHANGVHLIDGDTFQQIGFIPTGKGAHGLYVSRDSKVLYVSNRMEGSISLIDLATRKVSHEMGAAGRREPRYGRRFGGWQSAVAGRPLQFRGLRHRHCRRAIAGAHPGGTRPARPVRLPAAGTLLAGTHRRIPLDRVGPVTPPRTRSRLNRR